MQGASSGPAVHGMCSFWHDPFFSNFGRLGLGIMHSGFVHFELRAAVSNRNCYARSKFRACRHEYVQFLA